MFAGNFAPAGWELCDGRLMSIADNAVLFQLIGTTYGGDGQQTFALPDLRGRIPIHAGSGHILGEQGGTETVTLTNQQIPAHSHPIAGAARSATTPVPSDGFPAKAQMDNYALPGGTLTPLPPQSVQSMGGSQPHDNMQPFLCVTFIISLFGVFPSQN
jgi:microcystin-dependent protein